MGFSENDKVLCFEQPTARKGQQKCGIKRSQKKDQRKRDMRLVRDKQTKRTWIENGRLRDINQKQSRLYKRAQHQPKCFEIGQEPACKGELQDRIQEARGEAEL